MDEDFGYSSEVEDERHSSQWELANESLMTMEHESSNLFLQYRNYHLHLIQKRELPLERLIIPSSKHERLSFFRNYVSSPIKTQIACMYHKSFNTFFWEVILNSCYKSLQHTFVNIFLASYVPREHLFLAKMVPFMHGTKFCFIITGLLEVITYISSTIFLLDYLIGSISLKNPWNRCPITGYYNHTYDDKVLKINCYNVLDFGRRVKNKTVTFYKEFYYIHEDSEYLQLVQIEYFRFQILHFSIKLKLIYTCFIWALIALCHKQIFKKTFWKVLNIIHWFVISLDIASLAYLMVCDFKNDQHNVQEIKAIPNIFNIAFSDSDIDFLAESTTAPPVVHVLTARSTQEISPGRDSAILVLSNSLCFLFRAILSYNVKRHCENLVNVPILMPGFSLKVNTWLYFWPMYFSTFYLGDMYTLIFLSFNFAMELMTTVVTFQCLVEIVVTEWSKLNRELTSVIFIIIAIGFGIMAPINNSLLLAYNKSTVTLLECLILYCMYPVFRLVDDVSFHYGVSIHTTRVQYLVLVPFYYLLKYFELMSVTVNYLLPTYKMTEIVETLILAYFLVVIPLVLGMIYSWYKYVWKDKKSWKHMFAPADDWGPREFNVRQMRKNYDSRTYNHSEAPRNLSRHIIGRAKSKAYRLDIRYESSKKSNLTFKYS